MIRDREALLNVGDADAEHARRIALDCVEAGVAAVHPETVVRDRVRLDDDVLSVDGDRYDLADYDEVVVLGGGKAGGTVAAALEAVLGDRLAGGAVVTNDPVGTDRVEMLPGAHPVPSAEGVASTRRVLELADRADENTLVLAVVTGGGSALLAAPADGVSLDDLRVTTDALLDSGATIHEMNAVRKHLSALKGGRLAAAAAPATVVSVVFSDVVGDDLDVVASGPTVPDPTTFADALDVLDRYDLDVPAAVRDHLEAGARGERAETPKPDDPVFDGNAVHVLATNLTVLEAARNAVPDRWTTEILSSRVRGEAREAAKTHVALAEEAVASGNPRDPPVVFLSGGETTVTVRGDGRGGRNQEFALSAAVEMDVPDAAAVVVAAADTDGIDGSTDAAGAVVDPATVDDAREARAALADNDAFGYLSGRNALIRTGKTGTNVNDLRVIVVAG